MIPHPKYDVVVAGAGIIGLTLALELHARGAAIAVFDIAKATQQTSSAAAGMLAAHDPHNPPALRALSAYSLSLYPHLLRRIESLSGLSVPIQTTSTLQYLDDGSTHRLAEDSLDPRQLAAAVLESVRRLNIPLHEDTGRVEIEETPSNVRIHPFRGPDLFAGLLVHATGAWFQGPPRILPRKGQMLRVQIPPRLALTEVHRSNSVYIVPRTHGPHAGSTLIGATDEDAGFDLRVSQPTLDRLRARAAELLPALASLDDAPQLQAWAGLRPATADGIPLLGPLPGSSRQWAATGHYRNGILLAPATAAMLADRLDAKSPAIDLKPFAPSRFF